MVDVFELITLLQKLVMHLHLDKDTKEDGQDLLDVVAGMIVGGMDMVIKDDQVGDTVKAGTEVTVETLEGLPRHMEEDKKEVMDMTPDVDQDPVLLEDTKNRYYFCVSNFPLCTKL